MSNSHLFLKPLFIKTPSQNGVGRYICHLQRVVLKFCKNNGSSRGIREFIEHDLVKFATQNPEVVVYVKPRRHRSPILKAEYLNGETQWISCHNFTREEVLKWLKLVKGQSRNSTGTRIIKLWQTNHPSIQGPWTPYTFRDPELNLVQYPNEELSSVIQHEKSTAQQLIELLKKQSLNDLENKQVE